MLRVSRAVVREMVKAEKLELVTLAPGQRPRIAGLSIVRATQGALGEKPPRPPKPLGDPVAMLAYFRQYGYD
jgi:hypothetical protein